MNKEGTASFVKKKKIMDLLMGRGRNKRNQTTSDE